MTNPSVHAERSPDKPAVVVAETGETLSYRELDDRSRRLATALRENGLQPGDTIAVLLANHVHFLETYWAAMRSGLYFTPINTRSTAEELRYIVENSSARAIIADGRLGEVARSVCDVEGLEVLLSLDAPVPGYADYDEVVMAASSERPDVEPLGATLVYSSGSTGRPKGVRRPLSGLTLEDGRADFIAMMRDLYGGTEDSVLVCPAPLYHAAPLSFASTVTAMGGTVLLMQRFDAAECLRYVEEYEVTHGLLVPTMFVRLLRLDPRERSKADLSSLRTIIHGAGPCAVSVKRAMIDWLGPILFEYYAGSEDNGTTMITSREWLEHPGSVGRPTASTRLHVCDDSGAEVPAGQDGVVYFEAPGRAAFEYVGEADRTASSRHRTHASWTTLGDVGHLDDEGYLYLTDRKDHLIISGGVNISPQEIENALIGHEAVLDVAVVGLPDDEYGQRAAALVLPTTPVDEASLREELLAYLRGEIARHKIPKELHVVDELPRSPSGKLNKSRLRDDLLRERAR